MFVDVSFFEVEEGQRDLFEHDFASIVAYAREAEGCVSSELVRLDEERRYAWVERWISREDHNHFNQVLFGLLLPERPDLARFSHRLLDRDAEGYVVE